MPAASPLPRAPSVLTLASAADLLTGPGCPVCRYASEASDRYLAWFALEAHADPVMIKRLGASLGMCPRHTRELMGQPGAAMRLTAVFRYILQAARDRLAGQARQPAACPGCEHDEAAATRALGTLLEGLAQPEVKERLRDVGGLCGPHVRAAISVRRQRRAVAWLVQAAAEDLRTSLPSLAALAGRPDHDAPARADLRKLLPSPEHESPPVGCRVCAAIACCERGQLISVAKTRHSPCLCPGHLRDAAFTARHGAADLLAQQAGQQAACLVAAAHGKLLTAGRRKRLAVGCPVCASCEDTAHRELRHVADRQAGPSINRALEALCVRHVLALRLAGSRAAPAAAALAICRADALIGELAEAFRKGTWGHRHEPKGRETTAWWRAATLLDGGVSGGAPAEQWLLTRP